MIASSVADAERRGRSLATVKAELLQTLTDVGYEGMLTTEFVVPMDRSPLAGAREDSGTEASVEELKFIRDHGSDLMSDAEISVHFENCINHIRASEPSGVKA